MPRVQEWASHHSGLVFFLLLIACLVAFVLWLAAPVTWRNGEGSVVEDGENIRDLYGGFAALSGNLWLILLGKAGRG